MRKDRKLKGLGGDLDPTRDDETTHLRELKIKGGDCFDSPTRNREFYDRRTI